MKRFKMTIFFCVLVTILVTLLIRIGWAEAAPASAAGCGSWSIVSSPSPGAGNDNLMSVASISVNDVWDVGSDLTGTGTNIVYQTLAEHWDGSHWRIVSSPDPGSGDNQLNGVAAVSTSDVWAVGADTNSSLIDQTLVEHWDGSRWSVVPSPNAGQMGAGFDGIAIVSANDIWAVGTYLANGSTNYTLTEHWNGTKWSIVSSPNPQPGGNYLNKVVAISSSNVWAVGGSFNSTGAPTLVEHWNGSQWSVVSSPSPGLHYNDLTGVTAISANNIWAAGNYYSKGRASTRTLVEHWDGSSWNVVSSPNVASVKNYLWGITAASANNIWAVGYTSPPSSRFKARTLIEHWDGMKWSIVPSPNPPGSSNNSLAAVGQVPRTQQFWAVGDNLQTGGGKTLTEFYC